MNIRLHVFLATLLFSVASNAQSIGDCSSFQVATVRSAHARALDEVFSENNESAGLALQVVR